MVSVFNGAVHLLPNYPRPHSTHVPHSKHPALASFIQHRQEKQLIPYPILSPLDKLKDPNLTSQSAIQGLLKSLFLPRRTISKLPRN